ncbi:MAG: VOC family protein, partial [Pseudomonadota bacterium]
MSEIHSLGYLGLEVSDLEAWRGFAGDFLGAQCCDVSDGFDLRLDERARRISVSKGDGDDVSFLGWEVDGPEALTSFSARLDRAGINHTRGDQAMCERRGVEDIIVFQDPDGLQGEAYFGATVASERPPEFGRPVSGFVTGDQGLGHLILNVADVAAARRFYEGALGFRLTDFIRFEPFPGVKVDLTFLRCNARHHTLALASFPFPKRMQHFMLQYRSLDDVGRAYDMAQAADAPITLTLGRHTNDHMTSFYVRTPS